MENKPSFFKTTIIGGIFFLIPIAVVIIVAGKLAILIRGVADVLLPVFPTETLIGTLVLNLLALVVVVGFCFLAGLVAHGAAAGKLRAKLEASLLAFVPGYSFVKGMTDSLRQSEEVSQTFLPVLVRFDDYSQLAFEIEREPGGRVAVYLPGAPNPWSGTVVYVTEDRVKRLQMSVPEAVKNAQMLGKGSLAVAERMRTSQE